MSRLKFLMAVLLLTPAAAVCEEGERGVCPRISVTCPTEMTEMGTPMTFSAKVNGGATGAQLAFNWTASAGTIVNGQGTPSMILDTIGLGGQNIKVTVEVEGLPESCATVASCAAGVTTPPACNLPLDRYSWEMKFNDEKARLDNFAIALLGEPAAKGYVVMNPGEDVRPAEVRRRVRRTRAYLTNNRGVDPERVVFVYGADTGFGAAIVLMVMPPDVKFPFAGEIIR